MNQSKTKNIGGDSDDPFYRYKRNIIEIQHSNKKGGITAITNMDIIQKQLKIPNKFVTAFYKKVKKTGKGMLKPGVFRGNVNVEELEKILDEMIEKYVLCPTCHLPEWNGSRCAVCGHAN